MTTLDPADSTRRALREALAALNRGDAIGASAIARAHAAGGRPKRGRVQLVLPIREGCSLVEGWDDTEAS